MEEDPWLKHLEQIYVDRDNGAKASDPEDLRTLMLRRIVVTFGVDSDYVNSLMPLLVQQFVIEYARSALNKLAGM